MRGREKLFIHLLDFQQNLQKKTKKNKAIICLGGLKTGEKNPTSILIIIIESPNTILYKRKEKQDIIRGGMRVYHVISKLIGQKMIIIAGKSSLKLVKMKLKIHIFVICGAIFSKLHIFTNFNELFPAMIIIFLSDEF